MALRLFLAATKGEFRAAITEKYRPVARAATAAMHEAAVRLKSGARAEIAKAGFSQRWQNTLRVEVYPKGRPSINAAAFLWHKIGYAGIFETGGTIIGKPYLWLPTPAAPKGYRTPAVFQQKVAPLVFTRSRAGRPMLVAKARSDKAASTSLGAFRRGTTAGRGTVRSVVVFVGHKKVDIPKKFNVAGVAERVTALLSLLYFKNFRDD